MVLNYLPTTRFNVVAQIQWKMLPVIFWGWSSTR